MTNEEQKLREIAYKHAEPKVIWNDGNMSIYPDEEKIESLLSDLTALISEHYYPKEKYDELLQQRDELKEKYSKILEATSELLKSMKTDNAELKKSIAEMRINMAKEIAAIKNTER